MSVYPVADAKRDRSPSRLEEDGSPTTPQEELDARTARRARSETRRYGSANGLSRLGTLTYAPTTDLGCDGTEAGTTGERGGVSRSDGDPGTPTSERSERGSIGWKAGGCYCGRPRGVLGMLRALEDAESFVRRLRRAYFDGRGFPYMVVPELHKDGHVHLHIALGEYVPKAVIEGCWGHGYVEVRKFSTKKGGRADARAAAGYVAKYIGKTFEDLGDERWPKGKQRYRVAEGFQPRRVKRTGYRSSDGALQEAVDLYGLTVDVVVRSDEVDPDGYPWLWALVEDGGRLR